MLLLPDTLSGAIFIYICQKKNNLTFGSIFYI